MVTLHAFLSLSTIALSVCFVSETRSYYIFMAALELHLPLPLECSLKMCNNLLTSPEFVRQGLSLNMELAILAKVDTANHQHVPVFLLPGLGLQMEPVWGLGSELRDCGWSHCD